MSNGTGNDPTEGEAGRQPLILAHCCSCVHCAKLLGSIAGRFEGTVFSYAGGRTVTAVPCHVPESALRQPDLRHAAMTIMLLGTTPRTEWLPLFADGTVVTPKRPSEQSRSGPICLFASHLSSAPPQWLHESDPSSDPPTFPLEIQNGKRQDDRHMHE
ncbi:hypothetical protein BCV70DRAFT_208726 [Testicularia cyperi]|uniref:Uncharacterized protein n=1 Tax=Testicularia cyperi TaxID=1882483 RepID=A0A317XHF0_9BASI|nr:hypothetical protein BCV70DRAFT_208726 [Testicularia cyperi]